MTAITRSTLAVGDEVYWTDPDHDFSSGHYRIVRIDSESGRVEEDDTIVVIKNSAGSCAEVFAHELS